MDRRQLGSSGVEVTRFALGTGPLAGLFEAVGDEQARATVDAAWELGVRTFDTAPHYGAGLAEQRLGAALRDRPRDEYVLSTKVGRRLVPGSEDDPQGFAESLPLRRERDYSRDGVRRSLGESLERLGLDRIDVALVHDAEDHMDQAIAEAFPALVDLREQGVVRAIGTGLNYVGPMLRVAREADVDCILCAGRYTLLDRSAADELFGECEQRGIGVLAAGVFNSGILAGGTTYDYQPAPPELLGRANALESVCGRHGVPLSAAALQFPLRHPAVTCVLVGVRSPEEVRANVAAFEQEITAALWAELP
jgi:D-threo-aldose 1-dehydrogenase